MSAIAALDGRSEAGDGPPPARGPLRTCAAAAARPVGRAEVDEVKDEALRAVNDYFERRLMAVPSIKAYLDELVARA